MSLLPPRKKDWIPGKAQIGLFIRTPDGRIVEVTANQPTVAMTEAAYALLHTIAKRRPVSVSEVRRLQRRAAKKAKAAKKPRKVPPGARGETLDVDPRDLT